jgi:hypothetical protein
VIAPRGDLAVIAPRGDLAVRHGADLLDASAFGGYLSTTVLLKRFRENGASRRRVSNASVR